MTLHTVNARNENSNRRDIFTLSMLAVQPILYFIYPTWISLALPVIVLGGLAGFYTMRDEFIYRTWNRSSVRGIIWILIFGTGAPLWLILTADDFIWRFVGVLLGDAVGVYWLTMLFYGIRRMRTRTAA